VQSAVVPASTVGARRFVGVHIQTEKPRPTLKADDEASKKRNKRMFGNLLFGTLREAQKETTGDNEHVRRAFSFRLQMTHFVLIAGQETTRIRR
jgi:hypothetical protein